MIDKKTGGFTAFLDRMNYLDEAYTLSKYIIANTTDKEDAPDILKASRKLALLIMKQILK